MAESQVATSGRRIYADVTSHPGLSSSNVPISRPASAVDETPSLSAFGEPIPPSQVEAMAKSNGIPKPDGNADPESIKNYESATWEFLRQVIDELVESADSTNLKSIVAQLFAENIVRGRGLFATACMRCQSKNPHLTPVYGALVGLVNKYFPPVGDILYRRLRFKVSRMSTGKYDEDSMNVTIKFLAQLINLKIVNILDPVKLIRRCLERETEGRVKLAVTLFKELKLPGHGDYFEDIHQEFTRIKEEEKLKKEIRDMAAFVVARRNWNHVFRNNLIVPSKLQWVISSLEPHLYLFESKKPATNQDIFLGDVYRSDKYFLQRERAYYLFMSIILCESYWDSTSPEEERHFSHYDEVVIKSGTEDQQSSLDKLLLIITLEDEVQVCLGIFKYSCLNGEPLSLVPLIELLCKRDDKWYKEALETCFLVMWLMVAGESHFIDEAAEIFADLLHRGCLSWDFVAHLPFEPQNMTKRQYSFLEAFFTLLSSKFDLQKISENLFCCCPCVPAAITFFKIIYLDKVAKELEKLWKEKNCIKTTKAARLKKGKYVKIANPNEATELREDVALAQAEHKQHHDSAQAQQIQHAGKRKRQRKMPM